MRTRGSLTAPAARLPSALLVLVMLAGCGAGPTVPGPDGTPPAAAPTEAASTPATPSPAPEAESGPTSRLGLDCADLLPPELLAETVAGGLVALPYAAIQTSASPLSYAVEQLGGTACAGTGDTAAGPLGGAGARVPGYTVLVLPDAAEQYARYADVYPDVTSGDGALYGDSAGGACFGRGGESSCTTSILVGSTWIEIGLTGIDVDAAVSDGDVAARVAPLIESIVTRVGAAPAPGPLWTIPTDTVLLPEDCTAYGTADEVRAAFEPTEDLWVGASGGGGWSLPAGAWVMSGAQRCSWLLADTDIGVLQVEALPGGSWAFDAALRITTAAGLAETVAEPIPGVDRASFGCIASLETCRLDTVIGGNWVQFSAESVTEDTDALRDRLVRVADGAAARLAG